MKRKMKSESGVPPAPATAAHDAKVMPGGDRLLWSPPSIRKLPVTTSTHQQAKNTSTYSSEGLYYYPGS